MLNYLKNGDKMNWTRKDIEVIIMFVMIPITCWSIIAILYFFEWYIS